MFSVLKKIKNKITVLIIKKKVKFGGSFFNLLNYLYLILYSQIFFNRSYLFFWKNKKSKKRVVVVVDLTKACKPPLPNKKKIRKPPSHLQEVFELYNGCSDSISHIGKFSLLTHNHLFDFHPFHSLLEIKNPHHIVFFFPNLFLS